MTVSNLDRSDEGCPTPEEVILVHGTFAADDDDRGSAWWQSGSQTDQDLEKRLSEFGDTPTVNRQFHWSGENHERARSKAAKELLDYVAPLEKDGRPYHLIGHSHGGSVIWAALRLATARKKRLKNLRSWSTVGTPFLRHQSRSPWNAVNLLYMILAAVLLIPAGQAFVELASMPYDAYHGKYDKGIMMRYESDAGVIISVVRAPIVGLMKTCGVEFTETPDGIRLGSFDPASGDSFGEFLFGSIEGWVILAGIALFAYVTLLLGAWFLGPVIESLRIRFEHRLEKKALKTYGHRWLAIWSKDDEAINGLRATLEMSVTFLGKLAPRERIFLSDSISLVSRPCFWVVARIYNVMLRPILDSAIRNVVIRSAQGNNRPAAQVVDVAPSPLAPPDGPEVPCLPDAICEKILHQADRHAADLAPKLRRMLAQPSFTAGLHNFSRELNGQELVHTAYFDHPEIMDLLAANIVWAQQSEMTPSLDPGLKQWFDEHKLRFVDESADLDPLNRTVKTAWPLDEAA